MKTLISSTHHAVTTTRRTKAKFESEVVREWTRTVCLTGRKVGGAAGGGDSQTGNEKPGVPRFS